MVSEMDRAAERLIVDGLLAARPDDGIVGEEGSARAGTSGVRWVVDPLDGTTNYLYGLPGWAVSIAAEDDGGVVAGVVADAVHGEVFTATRGRRRLPRRRADRVLDGRPTSPPPWSAPGSPTTPTGGARQAEVLARAAARGPRHPPHGRGRGRPVLGGLRPARRLLRAGPQLWDLAAGGLIAARGGRRRVRARRRARSSGLGARGRTRLAAPLRDLLRSLGAQNVS